MHTIDKKTSLLITASTFPRWVGDTEPRFILDLAKAYTDYFDVTVLAPAAPGAAMEETLEGVHVLRYHYFPLHKWETLCYPGAIVPRIKAKKVRILLVPFLAFGLWRALHRNLKFFDIVHAHWIIPQGIVRSMFRKPYILTGHGGDVVGLNIFPILSMKRKALRRAKGITVISEYLKETVHRIVPDKPVSVLSMGCDMSSFCPNNRIDNFFDQGTKPVVLFVGRLAEIKGVRYLIEAVRDLNIKLVIVGGGPLEAELKELAKPQGDKIVFLGPKQHSELSVIYPSADLFVAPSIITDTGEQEGLSIAIVEAMASGLPVIATKTGGIPELITSGENGILVEDKNAAELSAAIKDLINDQSLRRHLSENAMISIKSRDYHVIAEKYAKIIMAALEKTHTEVR